MWIKKFTLTKYKLVEKDHFFGQWLSQRGLFPRHKVDGRKQATAGNGSIALQCQEEHVYNPLMVSRWLPSSKYHSCPCPKEDKAEKEIWASKHFHRITFPPPLTKRLLSSCLESSVLIPGKTMKAMKNFLHWQLVRLTASFGLMG